MIDIAIVCVWVCVCMFVEWFKWKCNWVLLCIYFPLSSQPAVAKRKRDLSIWYYFVWVLFRENVLAFSGIVSENKGRTFSWKWFWFIENWHRPIGACAKYIFISILILLYPLHLKFYELSILLYIQRLRRDFSLFVPLILVDSCVCFCCCCFAVGDEVEDLFETIILLLFLQGGFLWHMKQMIN